MRTQLVSSVMLATLVAGSLFAKDVSQKIKTPIQAFMSQKLGYCDKVLEGITLENYNLVITNGLRLAQMTKSNVWVEAQDQDYQRKSLHYLSDTVEMIDAARGSNSPVLLKAYAKVTADCVDCHQTYRLEQRVQLAKKYQDNTQK